LQGALQVSTGSSFGSTLNVTGTATFDAGITAGALKVTGGSNLVGALQVSTGSSFGSTLHVSGQSFFDTGITAGQLHVTGGTTLQGALQVSTGSSFGSTLNVTGTATFDAGLTAGSLKVTGGSNLVGALQVSTGSSFGSTLHVSGQSMFDTGITAGQLHVTGGSTLQGTLQVSSGSSFGSTLNVQSTATFATGITTASLHVTSGASTFAGSAFQVSSGATFGSTMDVLAAATFESTVNIDDTTQSTDTLNGALIVAGGVGIAKNLNVGGNTVITGDLTVNGTTTTVNSQVTVIDDNLIEINSGPSGSRDAGIIIARNAADYTAGYEYSGFFYSEAEDEFMFAYTSTGPTTGSVTVTDYIPLKSSSITIVDTTNATGTVGALTVWGGAGIAKELHVGDDLVVETVNITPSQGDLIKERAFTGANNQGVAANITEFAFAAGVRAFNAIVSVAVNDATGGDLFANYEIKGLNKDGSWVINSTYIGDATGVVFSVTSGGQMQYTSMDKGATDITMKFRALTTTA
jgi:hypothetical protein